MEDPESTASRRTVPVEQIRPGTVALLRALKARQAADRLALGPGYPDSGLVLVDAIGQPVRPEAYSDRFRVLAREAGLSVVRLHAVRHTLALIMHRAGVPPVDAAALLGPQPGGPLRHLSAVIRAGSPERCCCARCGSHRVGVRFL